MDILLRSWNKLDLTANLIASIQRNTTGIEYQIICVDNGSSELERKKHEWKYSKDVIHVALPFNHGSVRGINVGLALAELSPAPYILLLDNDTAIPEGDCDWLERFIKYLDDPSVGAAGAVSSYVSGYQNVEAVPDRFTKDFQTIADGAVTEEGKKDSQAMPVLVSFAMLLRKEAVMQVGLWDERYEPGNYEDFDYSLRLREAGWKLVLADSVWIHHKGSQTFNVMDFKELLAVNARKFVDKWGAEKLTEMGIRVKTQ